MCFVFWNWISFIILLWICYLDADWGYIKPPHFKITFSEDDFRMTQWIFYWILWGHACATCTFWFFQELIRLWPLRIVLSAVYVPVLVFRRQLWGMWLVSLKLIRQGLVLDRFRRNKKMWVGDMTGSTINHIKSSWLLQYWTKLNLSQILFYSFSA